MSRSGLASLSLMNKQKQKNKLSPTCLTQVDRDEAELRAEARRIQIERANKILFDETDRVKGFHSKLLLSDVMKENEGQVVQKKGMAVLRRAQEAAFVEQQRQALEVGLCLQKVCRYNASEGDRGQTFGLSLQTPLRARDTRAKKRGGQHWLRARAY